MGVDAGERSKREETALRNRLRNRCAPLRAAQCNGACRPPCLGGCSDPAMVSFQSLAEPDPEHSPQCCACREAARQSRLRKCQNAEQLKGENEQLSEHNRFLKAQLNLCAQQVTCCHASHDPHCPAIIRTRPVLVLCGKDHPKESPFRHYMRST